MGSRSGIVGYRAITCENRAPTVAELSHALPDHPASYIQHLYDYALANQRGEQTYGLNDTLLLI